ncbi:MAG: PDZ domain-containing protein [Sedimentisphaerales bacterium]|nr:PDZ domain-containing protein [Sedimentisphaerales bacterium]MBN2841468.1 PDZ domain-containing protein [Sedimentisphaerales bacterium]
MSLEKAKITKSHYLPTLIPGSLILILTIILTGLPLTETLSGNSPATCTTTQQDLCNSNHSFGDTAPQVDMGNDFSENKPDEHAFVSIRKHEHHRYLSQFTRDLGRDDALGIFQHAWQVVNYYYYNDISGKLMLETIACSLQSAINEPELRRNYNLTTTEADLLTEYIAREKTAWQEKEIVSYNDIVRFLINISDQCSGSATNTTWPILESVISLCNNLDQYSRYIEPDEYADIESSANGIYFGLGTDLLFRQDDYPVIYDILSGSPAEKAGLKPGDIVLTVDNNPLYNIQSDEFDLIDKDKREMAISIKRGCDLLDFSLNKRELENKTVRNSQIIPGTKAAFLRFSAFDKYSRYELETVLQQYPDDIENLIIDLRDNSGGIVSSAIDCADLFLEKGIIASLVSSTTTRKYIASADNKKSESITVIILVNEFTASAAELFTAALQENNRATVVGTRTFGKAEIQTIYNLKHNAGAIMITSAQYLPPSSVSIKQKGIIPDIAVNNTENHAFDLSNECITDQIAKDNSYMKLALSCIK